MTIEANLSRITELLEVLTEVVVEKLYDEKDECCEAGCLCNGEDDYGNNECEGTAILEGISAQVVFDGEEARAIARFMNEYPKLFTSTADFIRHATLSYTDTAFGNASEDDSSENEADIEFIASQVAGETFHELNTWLGQQINSSWQNRKNAEANAFELVFDKVQRFLKGER